MDLIVRYGANNIHSSSNNPWEIIFHAMRAGRYDAALVAA